MTSKQRKKHALKQERTSPKLQEKYSTVFAVLQKDSHCYKLLFHLINKGSITQAEAAKLYDIYRLSGRIFDLRRRGVAIVTEDEPNSKKSGTHARYRLKQEDY